MKKWLILLLLTGCTRFHDISEGSQNYNAPKTPTNAPGLTIMLAGQSNMVRLFQFVGDDFRAILAKRSNKQVELIPCAVGGTWSGQWLPGAGNFENCIEACKGRHVDYIFYWQGESDAYLEREDWAINFTLTAKGFMKRLDNLEIVFAQIAKARGDWLRGWESVQEQQESICLSHVKMIRTEDLVRDEDIEDQVHIKVPALLRIAKRFAKQIKSS